MTHCLHIFECGSVLNNSHYNYTQTSPHLHKQWLTTHNHHHHHHHQCRHNCLSPPPFTSINRPCCSINNKWWTACHVTHVFGCWFILSLRPLNTSIFFLLSFSFSSTNLFFSVILLPTTTRHHHPWHSVIMLSFWLCIIMSSPIQLHPASWAWMSLGGCCGPVITAVSTLDPTLQAEACSGGHEAPWVLLHLFQGVWGG